VKNSGNRPRGWRCSGGGSLGCGASGVTSSVRQTLPALSAADQALPLLRVR
jgi:hypothetical protein